MAKGKARDPLKTMQRRLSEGRGKGHGPDYQPYLKVRDVPSKGFSSRVKGWKTDRIHHLLSNLELNYFYYLEWLPEVVDIREQYPLPLEKTLQIASQLNIKHPTDPRSKKSSVMTTDFIIDTETADGVISVAISVKPYEKLSSARVIEKLELERRYWCERGISWCLVTEREIPTVLAKNVEIIHSSRERELLSEFSAQMLAAVEQLLFEQINRYGYSLSESALQSDRRFGLKTGSSLVIAQYLIAHKIWLVDMLIPLNFSQVMAVVRRESEDGAWAIAV